ncbi:hypothetical protein J6590_055989 [Homalodisca vitripennis]|nr:hypothetical protein J6590_055989 [Homalodisca vitripennis]
MFLSATTVYLDTISPGYNHLADKMHAHRLDRKLQRTHAPNDDSTQSFCVKNRIEQFVKFSTHRGNSQVWSGGHSSETPSSLAHVINKYEARLHHVFRPTKNNQLGETVPSWMEVKDTSHSSVGLERVGENGRQKQNASGPASNLHSFPQHSVATR